MHLKYIPIFQKNINILKILTNFKIKNKTENKYKGFRNIELGVADSQIGELSTE